MTKLICIIGPTCAGKTTLIDGLLTQHPTWRAIQIGKELRRRHPPEYFEGSAAPAKCQAEAWEIFAEQLHQAKAAHATAVLVDGVPRRPEHVPRLLEYDPAFQAIILSAPRAILQERSAHRATTAADALLNTARIAKDHDDIDKVTESLSREAPMALWATVNTAHPIGTMMAKYAVRLCANRCAPNATHQGPA